MVTPFEPTVTRAEICAARGVNPRTITRWLKAGVLPPPDEQPTRQQARWRLSSLAARGFTVHPVRPGLEHGPADV